MESLFLVSELFLRLVNDILQLTDCIRKDVNKSLKTLLKFPTHCTKDSAGNFYINYIYIKK